MQKFCRKPLREPGSECSCRITDHVPYNVWWLHQMWQCSSPHFPAEWPQSQRPYVVYQATPCPSLQGVSDILCAARASLGWDLSSKTFKDFDINRYIKWVQPQNCASPRYRNTVARPGANTRASGCTEIIKWFLMASGHSCSYNIDVLMYWCMDVCTYVRTYVRMYACMHVCMYACMHVCMYACMHVCMYACMHVCMYACMQVCMYACMYVNVCKCM